MFIKNEFYYNKPKQIDISSEYIHLFFTLFFINFAKL